MRIEPRVQTSVMLDPDVKKKLRIEAAKRNQKVSDLVNKYCRDRWAEREAKTSPPDTAA